MYHREGTVHREEIDNLCQVIDGHLDSMSSVRVYRLRGKSLKKINRPDAPPPRVLCR